MTCSRTGRRPPRRVRVKIDSLAFGGDAVARDDDGRVLFVAGGAPGDECDVEIEEEKKGFARGRVAKIVRPSALRVAPPCPLFVEGCGGCQWQHVELAAQRAAKEEIVRRALRHVAAPEAIAPIATPSPAFHWRRRARLRWRSGVLGYAERRSHRLIDVTACPQLDARLEAVLPILREALGGAGAPAGDVELLVARDGAVHVALEAAIDATPLLGQAGIAGVRAGGRSFGAETIDLGDGPRPFAAAADRFAQVSDPGNDQLRRLVLDGAGALEGKSVLELYAGSGNFTRDLAAAGARVVAVEDVAAAAELAARNVPGVVSRAQTAEAAVAAAAAAGERFDLIVLDPPRTGMARGVAPRMERDMPAGLVALAAAHIVYVSCDPATLARDLAALAPAYRVISVAPVDLMPQTFHVEIVTVLVKG